MPGVDIASVSHFVADAEAGVYLTRCRQSLLPAGGGEREGEIAAPIRQRPGGDRATSGKGTLADKQLATQAIDREEAVANSL